MRIKNYLVVSAGMGVLFATVQSGFAQGALTPPGAPAPTMKSLEQIEDRTPISSLPYTVMASGSYYVISNLTGASGQQGIIVSAENVSLDLNGFALIGVGGSLNGIHVPAQIHNLAVRNGTIRNWGNSGVNGGSTLNSTCERLQIYSNTGTFGLQLGSGCRVEDCTLMSNGAGISCMQGSLISGCTCVGNAGLGISAGDGSTIEHCSTYQNSTGISASSGCTVQNCTAYTNTSSGITVAANSTIEHCTTARNLNGIVASSNCVVVACNSSMNSSNGIVIGGSSMIRDCVASQNAASGIRATALCLIAGNTACGNAAGLTNNGGIYISGVGSTDNLITDNNVSENGRGIKTDIGSGFNLIVKNKATVNAGSFNFDLQAGNDKVGPISNNPLTNAPWANFAY